MPATNGVTAPFEIGVDRASAELKTRFLSGFAASVIRNEFPKLDEKMHVHTAVLASQSRAIEIMDRDPVHGSWIPTL